MDVGTKELRNRLSEILDRVERGQRVVIFRRGKPAAALTALKPAARRRMPDLSAFRARIRVRGKPLSQVVIEERAKARY